MLYMWSSLVMAEDDRTCVSNLFKKLKDSEIITAEQFYEVCNICRGFVICFI